MVQLRNAVDQINPSIEVEESFIEFPFSKILGEKAKLICKVNDTLLQLNLGLGLFLVEWSFFPENKQNNPKTIPSLKKKNEHLERVHKNIEMISKRTERLKLLTRS